MTRRNVDPAEQKKAQTNTAFVFMRSVCDVTGVCGDPK